MKFETIKDQLPAEAVLQISKLPYTFHGSGKVREIYDLGENLLIIATDRLSAFDVILPNGIPGKGIILTQISLFWFERSREIMGNHLVENHHQALQETLVNHPDLIPRSMLVKKLDPLPVEAVVRGYISGSGWKDYKKTGKVFGQDVPENLVESQKFPDALFTPTTKAQTGHDEPLTLEECESLLGKDIYDKVLQTSFDLYNLGAEIADKTNLVLADTKFEFGKDKNGELVLIDEVLTPDSSRYWPKEDYEPGGSQQAFDKQYVRDYLEQQDWDKSAPAPTLPDEVVQMSLDRYLAALERLLKP